MMILISGQPGNGKTLRALSLMVEEYDRNLEAVKQGKEQPRNFYSNVDGVTFDWVKPIPADADWRNLPDGSYVVYDEAHSDHLFPATGRPGRAEDKRIRDMDQHRHRGIDMVFVTQWPSKVHHELRQLCGKHIHMNRSMGLERAGVLTWSRVQPDPYDESQREKAEEEIWKFPSDLYDKYKSATLHTVEYKFRIPKKVWGALSMLCMMVLVGWLLWAFVFKPAKASDEPDTGEPAAALALAPLGAGGPQAPAASKESYLDRMQPRIPGAPWSAPMYDETNKAEQPPEVYCMLGESCRCITDQGTRYRLSPYPGRHESLCRAIVENGGILNPYRKRQDETVQQGVGTAVPTAMASTDAAPSPGSVIEAPQVSAYGDIGVGKSESAPR